MAELETQLEIAARLEFCSREQVEQLLAQAASLGKQLYALRNALMKKNGL
ncbi:MAG: four helix bundle protein [Acidobacteriota bacterium]|nr:four helix bundle protein [Acidobacteriota bacterium]